MNPMTRYEKTKNFILDKLTRELPDNLYYHGVHHVLDVLVAAEMLGEKEKISEHDLELVKVAVLFYHSPFILSFKNQKERGCELAKKKNPQLWYKSDEIESIFRMVKDTNYTPQP